MLPQLHVAKSMFEEKVSKLEELQDRIEVLLNVDEADTELENVSAYYEAKIYPVRAEASLAVSRLQKAEVAESQSRASHASDNPIEAKTEWKTLEKNQDTSGRKLEKFR